LEGRGQIVRLGGVTGAILIDGGFDDAQRLLGPWQGFCMSHPTR